MTDAIEAGARAVIAARKKWESREGPFGVYDLGYPDNKIAQPHAVRDFRPEARGAVVARFGTHEEAIAQSEFLTEQHYAKACIEAAIASGALVPSSAVAEMQERCAETAKNAFIRTVANYASIGPGGMARQMINAIHQLDIAPTTEAQPDTKAEVLAAVAEMRERCAKKCDELGDEIMGRAEAAHEEEEYDEYESLECAATEYSRAAEEIRQLDLATASGDYVVVPKALVDLVKIARNEGWYQIHPEWNKIDVMLQAASSNRGEK